MPEGAEVFALPVAPARPDIELGGEKRPELSNAMLALRVTEELDAIASAELVLGAWGGAQGLQYMDRKVFDFGKALKVTIGDAALFDGRVGTIGAVFPEGQPPRLVVVADDRLQDLRMNRRSRLFERTSPGEIARRIAADHQLRPQVDLEGPSLSTVAQLNQSDLAFLAGVARAYGGEVWVDGDALHFAVSREGDAVELSYAGSLRSFEVSADLAHQRSAVVAGGWDVAQRKGVSYRAGDDAVRAELGAGESGATILERAFGERVDTLAHRVAADSGEVRGLAEAAFRHAARRFVTGRGAAQTQPGLRAGRKVKLAGIGPLFSGEYRLTRVEHRFDGTRGLATDFECERAGLGRP